MEIDGGRKRILEGEEEVSSPPVGVDVPRPCLSRPGRQRNIASSLPQVPCFVLDGQDCLRWRVHLG